MFLILTFGVGVGGLFFNWLTGYIFTTFSPEDVLYIPLVCFLVVLCIGIMMQVTGWRQGPRYKDEELMTNSDDAIGENEKQSEHGYINSSYHHDGQTSDTCVIRKNAYHDAVDEFENTKL